MARLLITGGTGFVGANLVRASLARGHDVHLLVRAGSDRWRLADLAGLWHAHESDVCDRRSVGQLLQEVRPEIVFHLAAYGAYSWETDVARMIAVNLSGTVNLIEASLDAGVRLFVNTGSSSEYGHKDHPADEEEAIAPPSGYAVTKAAATLYCRQLSRRRQAAVVTFRLYSVFGPYEEPGRFIPTLIVRGLDGRLPDLVGPHVAHDYVFVDDVTDAYERALAVAHPPGAVYNVGTGTQSTIREVVEVARRELSILETPAWGSMPDRPWDVDTWVANITRIERGLGWHPRYPFADGFRRTVDWLRSTPLAVRYRTAAR